MCYLLLAPCFIVQVTKKRLISVFIDLVECYLIVNCFRGSFAELSEAKGHAVTGAQAGGC